MEDESFDLSDPLREALDRLQKRLLHVQSMSDTKEIDRELEHHYLAIAASVAAERVLISRLRVAVDGLREVEPLSRVTVDLSSRFPGGKFLHRVVGKVISRHTEHLYRQLRQRDDMYRTAILTLGDATIDLVRAQNPTIERRVAALADRVSNLEESERILIEPSTHHTD